MRVSTHKCDWCHHGEPDGTCDCTFKCDDCGMTYEQAHHCHTNEECKREMKRQLDELRAAR